MSAALEKQAAAPETLCLFVYHELLRTRKTILYTPSIIRRLFVEYFNTDDIL